MNLGESEGGRLYWVECCCLSLVVSASFVTLKDYSPEGSSVHGIFQARIL